MLDSTGGEKEERRPLKRARQEAPLCEYQGYSFQTGLVELETVDPSISPSNFFDRFISKRKPCILSPNISPVFSITPEELVEVAGDKTVQVEKRFSVKENFGQNRTISRQIQMSVRDVVQSMTKDAGRDSELLYLSTQQLDDDDGDGDNDDVKSPHPYQTPCKELLQAKKIDPTLKWGSTLRLESCNLWMGSSRTGSSSGLHHDYHDNFYLLIRGKKRFRLYSPDNALAMDMHGRIEKVHFNGLISYVGSETLADGKPVDDLKPSQSGRNDVSSDTDRQEYSDNDDDDDDEGNEVDLVLGKGFDYKSDNNDDEHEEADFDEDGHDDYEELVMNESSDTKDSADDQDDRPNSFCKTDPHDQPARFKDLKERIVDLAAGQILYLPAGWFHCVTSYSETGQDTKGKGDVHLALNYWYHPPTKLDSFEQPYHQ